MPDPLDVMAALAGLSVAHGLFLLVTNHSVRKRAERGECGERDVARWKRFSRVGVIVLLFMLLLCQAAFVWHYIDFQHQLSPRPMSSP